MQPGAPGGQPPQGYGQPPQGYPPQGGMPMAGPPAAPNPAQTAGIILIVCALAIAIGTFTKSWLSMSISAGGESASVGVGLLGVKQCESEDGHEECKTTGWGDERAKRVPGDIKLFGYLGFIAGLGCIGAAGAAGGMALSRNTGKIPHKLMLGVFGVGSFSMTFFLIRCMTEDKVSQGLSISYSGILGIGGLIGAGIVMKQMLVPHINAAKGMMPAQPVAYAQPMQGQPMMGQPMQQQPMMGQPMQQPMAQAAPATITCPRCQGQATFVAQYNRHFCNACQQYV